MMVGRVIYEDPKEHSMVAPDAPVVLKVEHLNAGKMVQDVSFELAKVKFLVSRDLWVQDVQRLVRALSEQTGNRVERFPLWTRADSSEKLQSTARRMLLNMASVICQRTEEDMVL